MYSRHQIAAKKPGIALLADVILPKTKRHDAEILEFTGAAEGTRTPDPIITNDVLYQLSYSGL